MYFCLIWKYFQVICPLLFFHLQSYKQTIHGPWDEASLDWKDIEYQENIKNNGVCRLFQVILICFVKLLKLIDHVFERNLTDKVLRTR